MGERQPFQLSGIDGIVGALVQDIGWLRYMWAAYTELYMNQDSLEAINATAPEAFNLFRFSLQREIIMAICRLCDPEGQGRQGARRNLTLDTLVSVVCASKEHSECVCAVLRADLDGIRCRAAPLRTARNKRFGHTDLTHRLTESEQWLEGITPGLIGQLILHVSTLVDLVREQLAPGMVCGWGVTSGAQHASRLVQALREVRDYRQTARATKWQHRGAGARGQAG